MIVVKLKNTLRVASEKVGKRLIPVGSVFRADKVEDFPEWLRDEIEYFKDNTECDTLLIKEMLVKRPEIDSNAQSVKIEEVEKESIKKEDDKKEFVKEIKEVEEIKEIKEKPKLVKNDPTKKVGVSKKVGAPKKTSTKISKVKAKKTVRKKVILNKRKK